MANHTLLGLLFWRDEVMLVRRSRPIWQFNKLTGFEAETRPGETVWVAMARALQEKSNGPHLRLDWTCYVTLTHKVGSVRVLYAVAPPDQPRPDLTSQDPTEPFEWVNHLAMPADTVQNLRWLIPLALDKARSHVGDVAYDWSVVRASRALPAGSVGKRHLVVTRDGSPFIGMVTAAGDDGVTLTDLLLADGSEKPDAGTTMIVKDSNLDVFLPYPPTERQVLLVAERMFQLGAQGARKE